MIVYLHDLGEGLTEAEIHQWYVKEGNHIKEETPIVSMVSTKTLVDILAPSTGKVIRLYGKPGDIIKTGAPLIEIVGEEEAYKSSDQKTVVGNLQANDRIIEEPTIGIQPKSLMEAAIEQKQIAATPAIYALAKRLGIGLVDCIATGPGGQITLADVEKAAKQASLKKSPVVSTVSPELSVDYKPLHAVRRAMAIAMHRSHQSVVPVTLVDDADIHAWPEKSDVTLRLIQAIVVACQREPNLNAWFNDKNLSLCQHTHIHLGVAMDTCQGLLVPVLKDIAQKSVTDLRKAIDKFKEAAKNRNILPDDLLGATFVLSNVGTLAGRYANPIIIPPLVAVLAAGKIREGVVADKGKVVIHKLLPLSLTVDHRVITGGEAARFLSALIFSLQAAS